MRIADLDHAFLQLDGWIDGNGWAGYDPYDVRGQDWFALPLRNGGKLTRKVRGLLTICELNLPPYALRKALRVKKQINAKGMGLMASAHLTRYRTHHDPASLRKAESILDWLALNACKDYPGISWGYPFHWHSRIFIPKGTPSIVVTGTVGDAWLDHYEITGAQKSLEICNQIAEFLLRGLNRSFARSDRFCFSYTPIDHFKVHNANLFGAAFLARLAKVSGSNEHKESSIKATRYTLSEQNSDGSFYYWGSEAPTIIDHYHTGFVLRHLDTVHRMLNLRELAVPLRRGFDFYAQELFTTAGIPKFTPKHLHPIDIHSCAEALLCLGQLGPRFGMLDRVGPVFDFTEAHMKSEQGWYVAMLRRRWWGIQRIAIPYLRWSEAWMLLALARLRYVFQNL